MHQLVLLVARVLELIHHDVAVAVLVLRKNVGMFPEKFYGKRNQVVKIHRIVKLESLLISLVKRLVLVGSVGKSLASGLYVAEKSSNLV